METVALLSYRTTAREFKVHECAYNIIIIIIIYYDLSLDSISPCRRLKLEVKALIIPAIAMKE
jgi:hypothetical protein